ncbi:hypothetical protein PseudUWO311_15135 [Pseudanabaena sp. UWO311]|uniref:hypothetical protein n=1 Tax=Pseudanabaena sp. UWO311 TaxID=2487337 RepID=UPI001156F1D5|nr:hypothetical protein [Pseudanabaena sp. UWO311]TYQ25558.1 hypothetical protein PseudUWO311_15135 [Pseudanabaena sp. UWO311]
MNTILSANQKNISYLPTNAKPSYNSGKSIKLFVAVSMPSVVSNSSNINSSYQITKQRLLDIDDTSCEDNEDDWGATRPTHFAWQKSLELLQEIEKYMKSNFPLGFANLASTGGIDLIWKNRKTENEVIVFIPSTENENISLYIGDLSDKKSNLWINPSIQVLVTVLQFLYQ